MITIQENLSDLSRTFDRYWKLTRKSRAESLEKLAKNVSIFSYRELRKIAPLKGAVRTSVLSAAKGGRGILISERAKELVAKKYGVASALSGKQFISGTSKRGGLTKGQKDKIAAMGGGGLQALMVDQELSLRESHRAFTSSAMLFKGPLKHTTFSTKGNNQIGRAKPIDKGLEGDEFHFDFGSSVGRFSAMAAIGMNTSKGRQAIASGVQEANKNMLTYIARKQQEAARSASRNIRRL